jgi:hypothetical protein
MSRLISLLALACLVACGGKAAPKPTASKVQSTAKSNQSALKTQKPATPMKTSTAPMTVPQAKEGASTVIEPADPTQGGQVEVDTWTFSNVDLDGDGTGESGVVLADEQNMLALWSSSFVDDESKQTVKYDAALWTEGDQLAGFIIDFGTQGAIACDASTCLVCTANGPCSEANEGADAGS